MPSVTIEIFKREPGKPLEKVIGTFDARDGVYESDEGERVEIKILQKNLIIVKSPEFRGSSGKDKREINLNKTGTRGEIQISDKFCLRVRISQ